MSKFRKKPVEIKAIQWNAGKMLMKEVMDHFGGLKGMGANTLRLHQGQLTVRTLEGDMTVSDGDWIIQGVKGELYPCKPDIFAATYEAVKEGDNQ